MQVLYNLSLLPWISNKLFIKCHFYGQKLKTIVLVSELAGSVYTVYIHRPENFIMGNDFLLLYTAPFPENARGKSIYANALIQFTEDRYGGDFVLNSFLLGVGTLVIDA